MMTKNEFETMVRTTIKRDGVENLLQWLGTTDFYTAPASSKYHGAHVGGLLEHCVNVYHRLVELAQVYAAQEYSADSLATVALFHDLCKVGMYDLSWRNVKNETTGAWEKAPFYAINERYSFGGHGSKSVYLIMRFMQLELHEAAAVNAHMGPWDHQDYGKPGEVYSHNKLAWLLHVADEAATFLDE